MRLSTSSRTRIVHACGGAVALVMIAGFFLSTVTVELIGSHADIADVKRTIVLLLPVLAGAMALTGGTGAALAGSPARGRAATKRRRMSIIAPNGLLILIPAALFLGWKASNDAFDLAFDVVQIVELAAGATNFVLLALNFRDGLTMTGRLRREPAADRG